MSGLKCKNTVTIKASLAKSKKHQLNYFCFFVICLHVNTSKFRSLRSGFRKINHLVIGAKQTQFEDCTFKNCDLTEANFNGCNFINCSFINCNLSMVKFAQNGLDHIQFTDCKMVGADFSNAKDFLFGVNFSNCILDYAALMKKKNRKAKFENCSLKGADFTEADLTETKFINCDFDRAIFMQSTLNGANFISSFNYTIDPERNLMRKAKFAASGLAGLLKNYGIIVAE